MGEEEKWGKGEKENGGSLEWGKGGRGEKWNERRGEEGEIISVSEEYDSVLIP